MIDTIERLIKGNTYPGRGIIIGKTPDGTKAVVAYFIMGRSENSLNRIFEVKNGALFTKAFDESKVKDPSLIIYPAVKNYQNKLIVTNGDQTDTILEYLINGKCFKKALDSRTFEPDAPNYTPRISGLLTFEDNNFCYDISILKCVDGKGEKANRFYFNYPSLDGVGHLIHTYIGDGNPLPSFEGEPKKVAIADDINTFAENVWDALDESNKISLFVRYIDLVTKKEEDIIINKNK